MNDLILLGSAWIDAVCSELGFSHVTETGGGGRAGSLIISHIVDKVPSKKVRLSDVVEEDVLLLKIDVEGYEDFVFKVREHDKYSYIAKRGWQICWRTLKLRTSFVRLRKREM